MAASFAEGTWNLISSEALNSMGESAFPYGPHPFGRLMMDSDGKMAFFIIDPQRPRFSADDPSEAIRDEIVCNYSKVDGYCGNYLVNEHHHTLTFTIEGSMFPNLVGTELVLTYELSGRILKTHSLPTPWRGEMWTIYSLWEHV